MVEKKKDTTNKSRTMKRPTSGQFIWMGVGLVLAVALFIFMRGFVTCWKLTALAGIPPSGCAAQVTAPEVTAEGTPGTPVANAEVPTPTSSAPQVELPPPWDGGSRVNILVMGYDFGDWASDRKCPCRSDSMIVLTIDPVAKTAGMLSVPRDMYVNIPGFNTYNKINAALYLGDLYKLPGGGPVLAMKTVENFLGIPIQYYALLDFSALVSMIDTIGGVCLDIPRAIDIGILYEPGTSNLEPGYQCVSGKVALGFARARDVNQGIENGDVERAQNQQMVILGIRDKVLAPGNFVNLMSKAPTLYSELSGGINTNLPLPDAMRLAVLAKDISLGNIQHGVIDYTMMQDGTTTLDGIKAAILRPFPDKIRELVDKIFGSGTLQPLATGTVDEKMKAEAARIVVVNGSGVAGMAAKTSDYLKTQGMNVIGFGNTGDYPDNYYSPYPSRSTIIVHAGKPYAMQYLTALLQFNSTNQIKVDFNPGAPEDIIVALGEDWGYSNPMP
jgi:polyisoprenyl-teichoic acid--peptidoglycan teichoic acid transferase